MSDDDQAWVPPGVDPERWPTWPEPGSGSSWTSGAEEIYRTSVAASLSFRSQAVTGRPSSGQRGR